MNRYRIVTVTDNPDGHEEHVSTIILTLDEAVSFLQLEQMLAEKAGWQTRRVSGQLLCRRGTTRRRLKVRESTPFDDRVT